MFNLRFLFLLVLCFGTSLYGDVCCNFGPTGPAGPPGQGTLPAYAHFYSVGQRIVTQGGALTFDIQGVGNGAISVAPFSLGGTELTVQFPGVYNVEYGFYAPGRQDAYTFPEIRLNVNGVQVVRGTVQINDGFPIEEINNVINGTVTSLLLNLNVGDKITLTFFDHSIPPNPSIFIGTLLPTCVGTFIELIKIDNVQ